MLISSEDNLTPRRAGRGVALGAVQGDRVWKRFRADLRNPFLIDRLEYLRDRVKGDTSNAYRWALRRGGGPSRGGAGPDR